MRQSPLAVSSGCFISGASGTAKVLNRVGASFRRGLASLTRWVFLLFVPSGKSFVGACSCPALLSLISSQLFYSFSCLFILLLLLCRAGQAAQNVCTRYLPARSQGPVSSVEVDDTEPEHDNVESEKGNAQEPGCVTFTRHCHGGHTVLSLRAQVPSLARLQLSSRSRGERHRLFLGLQSDSGSFSSVRHLLPSALLLSLSLCHLSLLCTCGVVGGSDLRAGELVFLVGHACLSFESVSAGEAGGSGDEIGDSEHDVENCCAHFLVDVVGRERGREEHNVDEDKHLFEARVFLHENCPQGEARLQLATRVGPNLLKSTECAVKVQVLVVQLHAEVAEHEVRDIDCVQERRSIFIALQAVAFAAGGLAC